MAHAHAADHGVTDGLGTTAEAVVPSSPLRLVEAAVTGASLDEVLRLAAEGTTCPVAVCLPGPGTTRVWPVSAQARLDAVGLGGFTAAVVAGTGVAPPSGVSDAVAVRVGPAVVGCVVALDDGPAEIARRPWLDAAAVAVAMTTLGSEPSGVDLAGARRRFLLGLETAPHRPPAELLEAARGLAVDLAAGAIAICAVTPPDAPIAPEPTARPSSFAGGTTVFAEVGAGRQLGLVALGRPDAEALAEVVIAELRALGWTVARSTARPSAEGLGEALIEAALMAELASAWGPELADGSQAETYRLLVGVFQRDPGELERLRASTVAALERYDQLHDTDLLGTLQRFLSHDGSTTETAEAMSLHRHTVGYRLARVHEVAGLSPYESGGRERLSLGLKADRILTADRARRARSPGATPIS